MNEDKLFAEFLGYKYYPHPDELNCPGWRKDTGGKLINHKTAERGKVGQRIYLARTTKDLRFSSDWNWLMSVVDKIKELGYNVVISDLNCRIVGKNVIVNRIYIQTIKDGMFENTYEACSSFVNGYKSS